MKSLSILALGLMILSENSQGQNLCRGRYCPPSGPSTHHRSRDGHFTQPTTPPSYNRNFPNHRERNTYYRPPTTTPDTAYRPDPRSRPDHRPGTVSRPGPYSTDHHGRENHNRNLWSRNRDLHGSNYVLRDRNEELFRRSVENYARYHHLPDWRQPRTPYRPYNHRPHLHRPTHHQHWRSPVFYHQHLPFSAIYFWNWIRVRVAYDNGYQQINGYPFYVYGGYSHRYSSYDTCNYELVDGYTNTVVANYHTFSCQSGYDSCALRRDQLNYQSGRSQYFCSERFDYDPNYNYNWDYDRDFYSAVDNY